MIVRTKLRSPRLRHSLVSRNRLMRMLDNGMRAKLTLITASAGYGKTTALSEWIKHQTCHVAWVSLDKQDNDWSQFWSCIILAMQESVPRLGFGILNEELLLILDDFHCVDLPAYDKSRGGYSSAEYAHASG